MKPVLTHLGAALIGGAMVLLVINENNGERQVQAQESAADSQPHQAEQSASRTQQRLDRAAVSGAPDNSSDNFSDEVYEGFLKKLGAYRPTRVQLMDYIASRNGDPEAIFAAGLILNDPNLLREAYAKEPDNPQYAFMLAACRDIPDDERLDMAQRLLELQPDNAIGAYLLAARHLEAKDTDAALDAMRHALTQPEWDDFAPQTILAQRAAYLATGSTDQGAQLISSYEWNASHLFELFGFARSLEIDDPNLSQAEARDRRRLLASMGTQMAGEAPEGMLVSELVGLAVQKAALAGMNDDDPSPFEGLTVAAANESITQRRNEIRDSTSPTADESRLLALPAGVRSGYLDRILLLGEYEANLWLRQQPEFTDQPTSEP